MQVALDRWLQEQGREHELLGMAHFRHETFGLSDLLQDAGYDGGPTPANVSWLSLPSGPDGEVVPAVRAGVYLVRDPEVHLAVLVVAGDPEMGMTALRLQVVADRPEGTARRGAPAHRRPSLWSRDVILPAETSAMIRRQVVGVAEHRDRLLAAGQHLKRGVLLHGPPGVGKTHSVRYLRSRLTDTTIVQLTGDSLQLIGEACSVARTLQPAMIVVEDVDLIAEERGMYPGHHPLLFRLLDEMDGLAEDADVVFLLTTNRADLLEPALAARPGRVDQAVALELPDAPARRALFGLYRGGLVVDESRLDTVIERTDGVTASFLKELLRRAALIAADQSAAGGALEVTADQLDAALGELLDTRNAMTRVLLGGRQGGSERAG